MNKTLIISSHCVCVCGGAHAHTCAYVYNPDICSIHSLGNERPSLLSSWTRMIIFSGDTITCRCMCLCEWVCMCVCVCASVCVCMYEWVCIHVCAPMCVHVSVLCTCAHVCIYPPGSVSSEDSAMTRCKMIAEVQVARLTA